MSQIKKSLLSGLLFVFIAFHLSAQVTGTDSLTNEPLNTASNIIAGNGNGDITISGYAQIDYNEPVGGPVRENGTLDVHRLIMFIGYKFNDRTHFVTEIEFEHITEAAIEQAFINYRINQALNFRAGLMLIPMGIVNEYHEPTTFNGVERPNMDKYIIPSTWRELGVGLSGNFPNAALRYQLYVINGFNGYDGLGTFTGRDGLRAGKQKGAESYISSPNLSGKVDYYGLPGLKVGLAGYFGKSQSTLYNGLNVSDALAVAQADSSVVNISMVGIDFRYQKQGFQARGQLVNTAIGNSIEYNSFTGNDMGSGIFGYYLEAGYDILKFTNVNNDKGLVLFCRYENYNTHKNTAGELTINDAYNRTDITIGATFKLANGAVLKTDYQILKNAIANSKSDRQLNFGVGVWF
ncbi:hypothetical protein [Reichenbachiella sp. MALMAid0571]|uniref:porin n=1 Tax=Reichenbachiella sp. MALMAid0571 TaxID=3143939 RepID=UPI0032DEF6AE